VTHDDAAQSAILFDIDGTLVSEVAGDEVEECLGDTLRGAWRDEYLKLKAEVFPLRVRPTSSTGSGGTASWLRSPRRVIPSSPTRRSTTSTSATRCRC